MHSARDLVGETQRQLLGAHARAIVKLNLVSERAAAAADAAANHKREVARNLPRACPSDAAPVLAEPFGIEKEMAEEKGVALRGRRFRWVKEFRVAPDQITRRTA